MNTQQQEFDLVVAHLFKQGRKSVNPYHGCSYRDGKGGSCAVGCRIPDEDYNPEMDAGVSSIDVLLKIAGKRGWKLPMEIYEYDILFYDLQSVHDNCHVLNLDTQVFDLVYLDATLAEMAIKHSLEYKRKY